MKNRIELGGCTSTPMGGYLKSLAVLRLVSEQADAEAAGGWSGDAFWLESELDAEGLVAFFLERYSPTPIVAPWNGGSGFYENDRKEGFDAILQSTDERFREYRETIRAIQAWPEMPESDVPVGEMLRRLEGALRGKRASEKILALIEKVRPQVEAIPGLAEQSVAGFEASSEAKKARTLVKDLRKLRNESRRVAGGANKEAIILACRNRLGDRAVEWVDAAVVLTSEGDATYPPILGTGGNEGRLDYTNTLMCRLKELLLDRARRSRDLLRNALFGDPADGLEMFPTGQYDPGRAGGFNQGPGIEHKEFPANPWNFVLAMEGAVAWAGGVSRRQAPGAPRLACSPFTVEARGVGYGSASEDEDARAEIWMPLWERPARYEEVRALLREGRAEIGRRPARDGLQFAEAAASLGVDRGINAFVRYSLLKRRGDSYVALPASRFPVRAVKDTDLLADLDPLLDRLQRLDGPARLLSARRTLEAAIYRFVLAGGAARFQDVVAALGPVTRLGHFARLRPEWLRAADDGSPEFRIAASLASMAPVGDLGPRESLSAAWRGNSLADRMASVLEWRMFEAERSDSERNPLRSRLMLHPQYAGVWLARGLDETRIENLVFGLSLLRWGEQPGFTWERPEGGYVIPRAWVALKLLFLPQPLRVGHQELKIKPEPAIVPLLRAGRIADACAIAQRRLYAAGFGPVRVTLEDYEDGVRLAAALLLPVSLRENDEYVRTVRASTKAAAEAGA